MGLDHFWGLVVESRMILKVISNRLRGCGLDSSGPGWGLLASSCEHANESLGTIKAWNLLSIWTTFCLSSWSVLHMSKVVNINTMLKVVMDSRSSFLIVQNRIRLYFVDLLQIREIPGSNLGPDTGYRQWGFLWFPWSLQTSAGIVTKLCQGRFFSTCFPINHSPIILSFLSITWVTEEKYH
jgi:hypothetical protein